MEGISRDEQEAAIRNEWRRSLGSTPPRPKVMKTEIAIALAVAAIWLGFAWYIMSTMEEIPETAVVGVSTLLLLPCWGFFLWLGRKLDR